MEEKFRFTDWRNAIWVEAGEVGTSIFGERLSAKGKDELFITITLSGVKLPRVVYRYHLGDALHEQVVKYYGDISEMEKAIREYIEAKEKQKE